MIRTAWLVPVLVCALLVTSDTNAQRSPSAEARRALDTVMPSMNLAGVTLGDALEFIRDVTNANVHVNWPALEAVGVAKDTPINVRVQRVSLRKVLDLILAESESGAPLTYYIDDGVIEITTREIADRQMVTKIYPVEDLILEVPDFIGPSFNLDTGGGGEGGGGGGQGPFGGGNGDGGSGGNGGTSRAERAESLIQTITEVIQPDIWQINGGTATIRFFNGSLIITAPRSVHEALAGPTD